MDFWKALVNIAIGWYSLASVSHPWNAEGLSIRKLEDYETHKIAGEKDGRYGSLPISEVDENPYRRMILIGKQNTRGPYSAPDNTQERRVGDGDEMGKVGEAGDGDKIGNGDEMGDAGDGDKAGKIGDIAEASNIGNIVNPPVDTGIRGIQKRDTKNTQVKATRTGSNQKSEEISGTTSPPLSEEDQEWCRKQELSIKYILIDIIREEEINMRQTEYWLRNNRLKNGESLDYLIAKKLFTKKTRTLF